MGAPLIWSAPPQNLTIIMENKQRYHNARESHPAGIRTHYIAVSYAANSSDQQEQHLGVVILSYYTILYPFIRAVVYYHYSFLYTL